MNKRNLVFFVFVFSLPFFVFGQENSSMSNIDSLFETPPESAEIKEADKKTEEEPSLLEQVILSRGFSLEASYSFLGLIAPGWSETPWLADSELPEGTKRDFNIKPGLRMSADLNLDIQLSDALRVQQSVSFQVLDPNILIKEFFFDYNFGQKAFVRAGQFHLNWGQSNNFQFTNLLARIPLNYTAENPKSNLSSKYLRINVPVGIGGFEGVLSARFIEDFENMSAANLGYGLKYNLIQKGAGGGGPSTSLDVDIGVFYHRLMPLRGFSSLQTTLFGNFEVYVEGLVSVPHEEDFMSFNETNFDGITFSGSLGLTRGFFGDKLLINSEVFYSGEKNAAALDKVDNFMFSDEEREVEIMKDLNMAFNLRFEPGGLSGLGLALGFRWAFAGPSGQIIPAAYLSLAKHIKITLAVPAALGIRTKEETGEPAYYYRHNPDSTNRPFSVIFAVSMNTSYRFGYYE